MALPSLVLALGKLVNEQNIEQVIELVEKLIVLGEQIESAVEVGLKQSGNNCSSSN